MISVRRETYFIPITLIVVLLSCAKYNGADKGPSMCFQKKEIDEFCQRVSKKQMVSSGNSGIETDKVVFTAWYSKHNVYIKTNETVKYDKVIENIGNGYNSSTGKFTVPLSGIYTMSVTMKGEHGPVSVRFMKNDRMLSYLHTNRSQSASTVSLLLKKGDIIWIQNKNRGILSAWSRRPYNVFSGVLITPM